MEPGPVRLRFSAACRDQADEFVRRSHQAFAAACDRPGERRPADRLACLLQKGIHSYQRLCLEASYKTIAVAMAEFKDSTVLSCGIRSTVSHCASSSEVRPWPSLPIRTAVGFCHSHSLIVVVAEGEVPTRAMRLERTDRTASSRLSGPAWAKRTILPVLARTTLPL